MKKSIAKIMASALALSLMALSLSGCSGSSAPAAETTAAAASEQAASGGSDTKIVIQAGHVQPTSGSFHAGLEKFKEVAEAESNGSIEVQIFSDGTLGGEREMIEGMQAGTVDAVFTTLSPMASFTPNVSIFDIPFLYRDYDHAKAVWDSEIGDKLKEDIKGVGVLPLGFADFGFRYLTNSKRPVVTPDDLKGLKIRVMQSEMQIETWQTLGADPQSMSITEVFNALQTGVVDGQENPFSAIKNNKFNEVQKYLSFTGHMFGPAIMCISQKTFDKLSADQQAVIIKAGEEAAKASSEYFEAASEEDLKFLLENGMESNDVDRDAFIEAVQPLYEKYNKEYESVFGADILTKIQNEF